MIDPRLLRDQFSRTKELLSTRGLPEDFDKIPALDERRRSLLQQVEEIRARKNRLGPQIAEGKKQGSDVSQLLGELRQSGEQEKEMSRQIEEIEAELTRIQLLVPNVPHDSVPLGTSEEQNRQEKAWGEKPSFSFTPRPHWDLAEELGILNFEAAARLSGARFSLYLGDGARLERALINFMLEHHARRGYLEVVPPFLVREDTMTGSGQLPKFEADLFKTAGEQKLYLIPTAEVPLCNLHVDQILEAADLPLCYTAYTPCFRAEAGSYGRDVRGLIRLHQFNKVELVKITDDESSYEEHEKLTRDAESILEALNLPYRRMTLCSGDMGMAAAKTYDLEVWLPGLDTYREISSCSNTEEFQARRTRTRFRKGPNEKPRYVHMLNGSGLAVGRTFIAILENYQQSDGSIVIPEALRPYMNGQDVIVKRK